MKKIIALATLLLAVLPIIAQVDFTLKGKAFPGTEYLLMADFANKKQVQTVSVRNGTFTVKSSKPRQTVMMLLDSKNRSQSFFIVDGPTITVDMTTHKVAGSKLNDKLSALMAQIVKTKGDKELEAVLRKAVANNKDNAIAAFAMSFIVKDLDYSELKAIAESNAPFLKHPLSAGLYSKLKALELRIPGTMFKDLEEFDTKGVTHKLSEYVGHGNYVLIDFWASWCGPCMMEMPNLKTNYEKYKKKGFNIVGLSFDRSADAWIRTIASRGLNWTHLSDLKYWSSVAAKTYGIHSIPASILCDPKGKIVAVDLRGKMLGQKLKEIYGF